MYKDREGKLVLGPIWDYDRSMGSTDGRDLYWDRWENNGGDGGTSYFAYGWYGPLFGNQPPLGDDWWAVRYRERWRELRAGPLSSENVLGIIDSMAAEIGEAALRNWDKWHQGSSNYQVSANNLRTWIERRLDWIDNQFVEPPHCSPSGGLVEADVEVTLSAPAGEIFYTLNGPDPKSSGVNPRPEALRYSETGPIRITENTKIQARARIGTSVWTSLVTETYYMYLLPLAVTEIMYNPPSDPEGEFGSLYFEFLEVKNIGDEEISLEGVEFLSPVKFKFSLGEITTLGAGEYVVIPRNREAFEHIYGQDDGIKIAGFFSGTLSNTRGRVVLQGPVGEPLANFIYDDDWHPTTDGDGYSLVLKDPTPPRELWETADGWRPSYEVWGSPGRADTEGGGLQLPGDFNQDGRLTVSDAVSQLRYLFGIAGIAPCSSEEGNRTVMDINGDSEANLADPVYLLDYLFLSGIEPALGRACVTIVDCPDVCTR
jgi:hypothetical protein